MPTYRLKPDTIFRHIEADDEDEAIEQIQNSYDLCDMDWTVEEESEDEDPWMLIKLDHTADVSTCVENHVQFQSIGFNIVLKSELASIKKRLEKAFKKIKAFEGIRKLADVYYNMMEGYTYSYTELIAAINNAMEIDASEKRSIETLVLNHSTVEKPQAFNCMTVLSILEMLEENIAEGAYKKKGLRTLLFFVKFLPDELY